MPTLVYKYGLLAPIENADIVRNTILLANRYRNTLTEIERGYRNAVRSLEFRAGNIVNIVNDIDILTTEKIQLEQSIKSARARASYQGESVKNSVNPEIKDRLQTIKTRLSDFRTSLKNARNTLKSEPSFLLEKNELDERCCELQVNARKYSGLFWGTYLLIEAAHDQTRKMPLYYGTEPNDPIFRRFDGTGQIGVQIQSSATKEALTIERLFANNSNYVRLEEAPISQNSDPNSNRSRNKKCRMILSIRVGSNGRQPIWARFPMILHRPLPPGSTISWVKINLRKNGIREEWTVDFTLQTPEYKNGLGAGEIFFNFGWRQIGDNCRVAAYHHAGETNYLELPQEIISGIKKAGSIRSTRDANFNTTLANLVVILNGLELPEWLLRTTVHKNEELPTKTQALNFLSSWKSQERLSRLIKEWGVRRFAGDDEAFEIANTWRYHDFHLLNWESGQRRSSLRRRNYYYKNFANRIAQQYSTLIIPDVDHRQLALRPKIGETNIESAASNRFLVAVSELSNALITAFKSKGGIVKKISSNNITQECHVCHVIANFDAARKIVHTCDTCNTVWDQDDNACHNIRERYNANNIAAGAREDENINVNNEIRTSKWTKAKQGKVVKNAAIAAAREALNN